MATRRKQKPLPGRASARAPIKPRVARWFQNLGREQLTELTRARARAGREVDPQTAAAYLSKKRAQEEIYLHTAVKELRQYFTGFDASDGYSLTKLHSWSARRVETIRQYSSHLRHLQSNRHVRATASSAAGKKALAQFTGQYYKGTKKPRAYVVHVDHPDRTQVKYDKKSGKIKIIEKFRGGRTIQQFYFFRDYGLSPFRSWEHFIEAVRYMTTGDREQHYPESYRDDDYSDDDEDEDYDDYEDADLEAERLQPILPPGMYTLWSEKHGTIFQPMPHEDIILNLNYRFKGYDPNFTNDILGFRYFKDELSAERQIIDTARYRREASKRKKERSKLFDKQLRTWKKPKQKRKSKKKLKSNRTNIARKK